MASSQQIADLLLAQWQALWALPPQERMKLIEETKLDADYENQIAVVRHEMELA